MADSFPEKPLFNKYEVGKLLGCGAFAKVYHGREIATGKSVAIKVIQKSRLNNNAHLMAGITREISIMRRLRHPYAVKLYEVLATKTKIYFVMEFVKGGELFQKVAKGRFTEAVTRKYFHQLISAVSHFHSQGIYHRDLKPENLLLDENEDLKVSDFGLSALTDQIRSDGLLHTLCGTPAYVAPEILAKKGYDGAKIDIWSCGVILFVLIAGYLPFHDSNLMNMYRKIHKGEYRCPKWISPALKRLISRLLDVDPSTRITVVEIKQDPWFRKGYKEINLHGNEEASTTGFKIGEMKLSHLNAFDIISFSSGLDISGILNDGRGVLERMAVEESPEIVMENVVKAVEGSVKTTRRLKDCAVELEGQESNFVLGVEVYRLTDRLVVVEAKWKSGDADVFANLWKDKIRPLIVHPPVPLVTPLPSSVTVN